MSECAGHIGAIYAALGEPVPKLDVEVVDGESIVRECLCWVHNMGTRHTRIQHPECPAHPVEATRCLCWVGHGGCGGCSGLDFGWRHEPTCGFEQNPDCPIHGTTTKEAMTESNETEQRHLADGLRVAAPVQPEMDALRAALGRWSTEVAWEPEGSLGQPVAYDVADAARAVLAVYDEQVAAMERARNFHVNETMLRKLTEG